MSKSLKYSIPFFLVSSFIIAVTMFSYYLAKQDSSQKVTDRQSAETNVLVTVSRTIWKTQNVGIIKTKVPVIISEQQKLPLRFFDVNVTYDSFSILWLNKPAVLQLSMVPENLATPETLNRGRYRDLPSFKPESDTVSIKALGSAELKISPSDPIVHRVSKLGTSIYQWKVEPLSATKSAKIVLTTSVQLDEGAPFPMKPYEMAFEIKSSVLFSVTSFIQAINPIWKFLLAFVPAMWGLYIFFRNRKPVCQD